ncbi:uncharacterized protein KD926_007630 [Aspergillus affinis]|uniref:uncharacterized protein n=1 Tax=Aspergillus affinis TaxID=1070780 RepID=UPI0022FEE10E|nr:uncharacterized protein KD926_007630 [Aspergillus affinis]KAI9040822.1 hypothetical protein KD926_007630 [Aspergillus affinis]
MEDLFARWIADEVLAQDESDCLDTLEAPRIKYAGSIQEPDYAIHPNTMCQPSVVVESAWSESRERMMEDMNLWLRGVGAGPRVQVVILLTWTLVGHGDKDYSEFAKGEVDFYVRDGQDVPVRQQQVQLWPTNKQQQEGQRLEISRRVLFGPKAFPGRDLEEMVDLHVELLREISDLGMFNIGLVPDGE